MHIEMEEICGTMNSSTATLLDDLLGDDAGAAGQDEDFTEIDRQTYRQTRWRWGGRVNQHD